MGYSVMAISFSHCDLDYIGRSERKLIVDIHFTVGTSCESAMPLAKKNAATRMVPSDKPEAAFFSASGAARS
jgi:hypothetical protein